MYFAIKLLHTATFTIVNILIVYISLNITVQLNLCINLYIEKQHVFYIVQLQFTATYTWRQILLSAFVSMRAKSVFKSVFVFMDYG